MHTIKKLAVLTRLLTIIIVSDICVAQVDSATIKDNDFDGIPDKYETSGEKYLGLPLYDWGARPHQTDIFIEVDYMDPCLEGCPKEFEPDIGLMPNKRVLDYLATEFYWWGRENTAPLWTPIVLHFDVGSLFGERARYVYSNDIRHGQPQTDDTIVAGNQIDIPIYYNLGGGGRVPYAKTVEIKEPDKPLVAEKDVIADYYNIHMNEERKGIFYYMLFANMSPGGGTGQALIGNTVSVITLGQLDMHPISNFFRQYVTIAHELGHNLGLRHGGNDDTNRKINYPRVMNYWYTFNFSTDAFGLANEPDYATTIQPSDLASSHFCQTNYFNEPIGPQSIWRANIHYDGLIEQYSDTLDHQRYSYNDEWSSAYSFGILSGLNENSFNEQISAPTQEYIDGEWTSIIKTINFDFNCNGVIESDVSVDINRDGKLDILSDHKDWDNLYFYFHQRLTDPENTPEIGSGTPALEIAMPPF